jgi:hypothetical protein
MGLSLAVTAPGEASGVRNGRFGTGLPGGVIRAIARRGW